MERTERADGCEPEEGGREWITENIENINNSEQKHFISSSSQRTKSTSLVMSEREAAVWRCHLG